MVDLYTSAAKPFLDIAHEISGSLIYLDAGAGEIAHVSLGLPFLLGLGAANVCELERCRADDVLLPMLLSGGSEPSSMSIFTTQLLTDVHPFILHAARLHRPYITQLTIYSGVSEHAHACQVSTDLGVEAFSEYASILQQDMAEGAFIASNAAAVAPSSLAEALLSAAAAPHHQQQQLQQQQSRGQSSMGGGSSGAGVGTATVPLRVVVRGFATQMCVLGPSTMVLPAAGAAACMARAGGVAAGFGPAEPPSEVDGQGSSGGMSLLAHSLAAVAGQMGHRLETYALGPVSTQLAAEVASLPIPFGVDAGSKSTPTLGLILVDRSLDLVSPCLHGEHLMDLVIGGGARRQATTGARRQATGGPGARGPEAHVGWRPCDVRLNAPSLCPLTSITNTIQARSPHSIRSADATGSVDGDGGYQEGPLFGVELFSPGDKVSGQRVESLMAKKGKEAAVLLRKYLKEALRQEKLTQVTRSKAGTVPPSELQALAQKLLDTPGAALRHKGVAALGLAVAGAMEGPWGLSWAAAASLEKQISSAMADSGHSGGGGAAQCLMDACQGVQQRRGPLALPDLLLLVVMAYSMDPDSSLPNSLPFTATEEARLKAALCAAISAAASTPASTAGSGKAESQETAPSTAAAALGGGRLEWGGLAPLLQPTGGGGGQPANGRAAPNSEHLAKLMDSFFERMHFASGARSKLKDLRCLSTTDIYSDNPGTTTPLIRQLVKKLIMKVDIPDFTQAPSSSLRGILSGLGKGWGLPTAMLGSSKAKPADHAALLIFVVGGISTAEIREVRQEIEELASGGAGGGQAILLGGTALLAPCDVLQMLWA